MKTKLIVVAVIVAIIGAFVVIGFFPAEEEDTTLSDLNAEPFEVTRPDPKPIPNTFNIMSPEEAAAAKAAAERQAALELEASLNASSSATTTEEAEQEEEI